MTKSRIALTVFLIITAFFALASGSALLWYLFYFILLIALLGWLWIFLATRGLAISTGKEPATGQVGEWFEEDVTLGNRSITPKLMLKVEGDTDLPGYRNEVTCNLPPGGSYRWHHQVSYQRRGRFHLGRFTVTATDPFGFFSRRLKLGQYQPIVVSPETFDLPFFQPLLHQQNSPGLSRWLIDESSPNAARVRDYINGDSLRRIHWRSTAHTGKLMVKVFDPDRSSYANATSSSVAIFLDMHHASHFGEGDESTEECAVSIAASLVAKYHDEGKQVGLFTSGTRRYRFPPADEEQSQTALLEALALVQAGGETPLEELLWQERDAAGTGAIIIAITASTSGGLKQSLRHFINRGHIVVTILLDAASFGGDHSASITAGSLISIGTQVYVIHRGQDLAMALRD